MTHKFWASYKKTLSIFAVAFLLNLIWENAHALLYANYTFAYYFPRCLRATLWDAGYITLVYAAIALLKKDWDWFAKDRRFTIPLVIALGLLTASVVELDALLKNKWAYSAAMPLVPVIHVGLTPFLQLAILSLVTYTVVVDYRELRNRFIPSFGKGG
ncbi:hypothetical protein HY625_00620 [Candidatus Uhrbacteria bacterium]|nr:hypothetical protein [Candidatus Uhrbacteria bacterium]